MARPKPRRPKPGRGLPPPYRQTPEDEAEDERLRALQPEDVEPPVHEHAIELEGERPLRADAFE